MGEAKCCGERISSLEHMNKENYALIIFPMNKNHDKIISFWKYYTNLQSIIAPNSSKRMKRKWAKQSVVM